MTNNKQPYRRSPAPIIKIREGSRHTYLKAEYYYDHSGYFEVVLKDEQISCREDAKASDHLDHLAKQIQVLDLKRQTLKEAHRALKKAIVKMPKPITDKE